MKRRIILAGGSGFIGTALEREFTVQGYEVIILTRSPKKRMDEVLEVAWDGKKTDDWAQYLDGAWAIINLTGKNINCPHTPENLREITASRVDSVNALTLALAGIKRPPQVWVQTSATGFYGDTGNHPCDETFGPGNDVLAEVCKQWEGAFAKASLPQTRKAVLRIGFVLGRESGALPVLKKLAQCFLGGAAGNGTQYISWIHLADLVQMFATAVGDEKIAGTYNAVAPNPVTNAEFMRELRKVLHRPWSPPVPGFAVKFGAKLMGSDPSLALISQRCVPRKFLEGNFVFKYPELYPALEDLCA